MRGVDINITIGKVHLNIPTFIPDNETQLMLNESIKNNFSLEFDSWTTAKKTVKTGSDFQLNKESSSNINSPKNLIAVRQTEDRSRLANNVNVFAVCDHVDVKKILSNLTESGS